RDHADVTRRLRALWALHVTGGLDEKLQLELLASPHESIRAWTVQLGLEDRNPSPALLNQWGEMAAKDPSPLVRLYLASGLQRLPLEQRWQLAEALVAHGEDAGDTYLPLMIWYGIEPLALADRDRLGALIRKTKIPLLREFIAWRVALLAR